MKTNNNKKKKNRKGGDNTKCTIRIDSKGNQLFKGESERKDGRYQYREKNCSTIYAKTLGELRLKEKGQQEGLYNLGKKITISELIPLTIQTKQKQGLKATSIITFQQVSKIIENEIGSKDIGKFKDRDFYKFYERLINKGFSPDRIQAIHSALTAITKTAVYNDYIENNNGVKNGFERYKYEYRSKIKNHRHKTKEEKSTTQNEIQQWFDHIEQKQPFRDNKKVLLVLEMLSNTGLRIGELCALKYSDIDFENGEIKISKTVAYTRENGKCKRNIQNAKTQNSKRVVFISDIIANKIKSYKREKNANNNDYVFNINGQPYVTESIRRYFEKLTKYTGIKITPHNLRHYYTTVLIKNGIKAEFAKEILGHSNIATTINVYNSLTSDDIKKELQNKQLI